MTTETDDVTVLAPGRVTDILGFFALTVYLRRDLAEAVRVLHVLDRQSFDIEHIHVHLAPQDVSQVRGLELVDTPVMRLVITGAADDENDVVRLTKLLNRLIDVYKVVPTLRMSATI